MGAQANGTAQISIYKKTSNWIYYGVFLSIIAVIVAALIDRLLGYRWNQIRLERFPDIFLSCFAISSNLKSLLESEKNKLSEKQQDIFGKICTSIMLITLAIYAAVFRLAGMVSPDTSIYFFIVCILVIIFDAWLGVYITRK